MRGIVSEAMVMCASTPEKVEILAPPAGAVPGDLVRVPGFEGQQIIIGIFIKLIKVPRMS